MNIIRVKITNHDLPEAMRVWFASSQMVRPTPEETVALLNNIAKARGVNATYQLATEAEYWAYRAAVAATITGARTTPAAPADRDPQG